MEQQIQPKIEETPQSSQFRDTAEPVKKKIIKNFLILIFSVALILVVAGYYYVARIKDNTQKYSEKSKLTVRLGWAHQTQFAGLYVAKEKGFYEDVGLDVEILPLDEEKDQAKELAGGEVDASIMEAHQMLVGIGDGADLVAVAVIYQINPNTLAARADSGIDGPEDFTNQTVFGLSGGEGEGSAIFKVFIEKFKDVNDPKYVELGFDTVDDFLNKRADVIDIYRIDQPYLAKKNGVPLNIIPLDAYGLTTYGDVIAMNRDFIARYPETADKFVKATLKGWAYALAHTEEAIVITMPYTSGNYQNSDYLRHILTESVPLIQGSEGITLGSMKLSLWSTLYESMRSKNVLNKTFNVQRIFTNEFVQ